MVYPCPCCEREFGEENARYQHVKSKHGKKGVKLLPKPPRELSLGEELAEAMIAYGAGEAVPDYLLSMFPEQFEEARKWRGQ